jgi:hypothetical protein
MSNAHPFDVSVQRQTLVLAVKRWPDGYYEIDFSMTNYSGRPMTACMPLFSGKAPIAQRQVQEIKRLCCLGAEVMTEVDFDEGPF